VRFATMTLCAASQRLLLLFFYFVLDSVWKLLDTEAAKRLNQEMEGTDRGLIRDHVQILSITRVFIDFYFNYT
jgi:hypothetical protein